MVSKLKAVCSLDGRYRRKTDNLAELLGREQLCSLDEEHYFIVKELSDTGSEFALIRNRVRVELMYLSHLVDTGLVPFSLLTQIIGIEKVSEDDAQLIKDIEVKGVPGINNGNKTNHDVKNIEFYIRHRLEKTVPPELLAMIHFALTSEDVDNIAYTLTMRDSVSSLLSFLHSTEVDPSCARSLENLVWTGKFGGAVGNRSAHRVARPDYDWEIFGLNFLSSFNLHLMPMTTQIEPNDTLSEACQYLVGLNQDLSGQIPVILDPDQDDYINDLLGISTALLDLFSAKQPISRRQRDLSGSTIRRNYATAVGFTMAALGYIVNDGVDDVDDQNYYCDSEDFVERSAVAASACVKRLDEVLLRMVDMAEAYTPAVMLGRTHGQPAIPTTLGKEFGNFAYRVFLQRKKLNEFMSNRDCINIFRTFYRINAILTGFAQDVWQYISDEYILQKPAKGEVGSSTMPQKVNPIDFENAEGNLLISNSLLNYYSKCDSSSKALFDNMGMPFGFALVAYNSLLGGLGKIAGNPERMVSDVDSHPEVLAEPIQTLMRVSGDPDAYDKLKNLTRGEKISMVNISTFAESLPDGVRGQVSDLLPRNYVGDAVPLTEKYMAEVRTYLKSKQL
ncbi:hypothetical protein KY309_00900 [Candidatus Woesearchaeota archaeon]|nr:hypothetical protein [Candidatus Woesearchaeota archaeon]MBW3016152.1 hypothetical protein [Candidatus Woesearchaeota archaeon]